jgi:hypothetical protein
MMTNTEEKLLTRVEASAFLAENGYRVSAATLAKKACTGDGPLMILFGRKVLYRPAILLKWALSRSTLRANTSDEGSPALARFSTENT